MDVYEKHPQKNKSNMGCVRETPQIKKKKKKKKKKKPARDV